MSYAHSALRYDLRQIAVGEAVADVPTDAKHDDVDVEASFPEGRLVSGRLGPPAIGFVIQWPFVKLHSLPNLPADAPEPFFEGLRAASSASMRFKILRTCGYPVAL